jgi:beta-lysine 5,6-aminomutase alpha subunit
LTIFRLLNIVKRTRAMGSFSESKLGLDPGVIEACREAATQVAARVVADIAGRTTVSVERTVARLLGVDGVDELDVPMPNVLVDRVREQHGLEKGIAYWLGNAMLVRDCSAVELARLVGSGELDVCALPLEDDDAIRARVTAECDAAVQALRARREERVRFRESLAESPAPLRYMLTGTGDVYEDVVHGRAVAEAGGDVVALVRSTAQSLLDFVPYGATREGHGGTYNTQENFRIVRAAMDEWSREHGRYVRVSSFCSGLCMPEIAAMGALEGLDNTVNDALYGILYRDLNMVRTLVDQRFSRRINGYSGIVINTGEDNYLRTADAVAAAPSVVASQLINFFLALESGVPAEQIAVGNSFEIDPAVENGLLYELAHAQLTRELFPDCPIKYMPPTRHMNGNPLRTQACDTLFSLVSVATGQAIQTVGVPTEGIFTPHIHDRVIGIETAGYVHTFARDLGEEIEYKPGGIVRTRAAEVLRAAEALLTEMAEIGVMAAIAQGVFGDMARQADEGRGTEGIVEVGEDYLNPFVELMELQHA